ncbi:MAG: zinc ABC transporter substrate-binding protein [Hyphomicrobiales bacterium]|nr:MAG: zinc ABC transporter substrate-binding protein [Hyphomicrobiales bacterium]
MSLRTALLAAAAVASLASATLLPAQAADRVVASIRPVHSLVAAVMAGVGEPELIVGAGASPHTYSLKPSNARALQDARLIIWVSPGLETFLEKPIEALGTNAAVLTLAEVPGVTLLDQRSGGAFEKHDHDGEDHDGDREAEHKDDHDHDADHKAEYESQDHDHEAVNNHDDGQKEVYDVHNADHDNEKYAGDEQEHGRDGNDWHMWLDPANARAFVAAIAMKLAEVDPDNADRYAANAKATTARIDALIGKIEADIAPLRDKPFIVFHDAYQYFEHRFGLEAVGSITVSPEAIPGAARIAEMRETVEHSGAVCVFAEPQFPPKLVNVVIEGTGAKAGELDPLGTDIADGPDLYFELIERMAESFKDCLTN